MLVVGFLIAIYVRKEMWSSLNSPSGDRTSDAISADDAKGDLGKGAAQVASDSKYTSDSKSHEQPEVAITVDAAQMGAAFCGPAMDVVPKESDSALPEEHLFLIFERVALSQPGKMAVRSMDGSLELTYGDLLTSARCGAEALRTSGVRSGSLVGLLVYCSVEGCIGILSIVLSGGAYVPIDPNYPKDRIAQVVERAQINFVMTAPTHSNVAKEAASWLVVAYPEISPVEIVVHRAPASIAPMDAAAVRALHKTNTHETLMAVLFTSGSTGQPKGVPSYEAGTLQGARLFATKFPYAEDEVCIQKTTYAWVDHKLEFWTSVLFGKEMLVVPNTETLIGMVDSPPRSVHRLFVVPTLIDLMCSVIEQQKRQGKTTPLPFLKLVIATGEALTPQMVERYRSVAPGGTIVSSYGLSETQGETSMAVYGPSRPTNGQVSIGLPHAPYAYGIRSLESGEWISGAGAKGELYIVGSLILEGYYTRADGVCLADDSSRARFSAAPSEMWPRGHPARDGKRSFMMYQTGDLVTWREDGELQHLGRCDDQVKVNGVRIELGDVTAGALKCNGVEEARAVAVSDPSGKTRVVVAVSPMVPKEMLLEELSSYLPSVYMPSTAVALDKIPTLPNGKVDRKKLEGLAAEALTKALKQNAPHDSISRVMAGADSGDMPDWYYSCMHLTWLGMLLLLVHHIAWLGGVCSPSWCTLVSATPHIQLIFFSGGWFDLVGSPPSSWPEASRRWGIVVLVYLAFQPLIQALKLSNLWPVLAMIVYKTIFWPLYLWAKAERAPLWAASAGMVALGTLAFVGSAVCKDKSKYSKAQLCVQFAPLSSEAHDNFLHGIVIQIRSDFQSMFAENFLFAMGACYALYPVLIAHLFPDMWTPPPVDPSAWTVERHRAWRLLNEPAVQRLVFSAVFLVFYLVIMISYSASDFFRTEWAVPVDLALTLGLFASLLNLLPSKPTVLAGLGACTFVLYVMYMSFLEPHFFWAKLSWGDPGHSLQIARRVLTMTDDPVVEIILITLLAGVAQIAASFSVGFTAPVDLPNWLRSGTSRYCGGWTLPEHVKFPKLTSPCGTLVVSLAWITLLSIPYLIPLPSSDGHASHRANATSYSSKLHDLARKDNFTLASHDIYFVGWRHIPF